MPGGKIDQLQLEQTPESLAFASATRPLEQESSANDIGRRMLRQQANDYFANLRIQEGIGE